MRETTSNVNMFKKILVGVDDSEDAQLAFRYAMNRAKTDGSQLIICSIIESDEMNVYQVLSKDYVHGQRDELKQHLEEYKKIAERFGVANVRTVVAEGDVGETIVKKVIPQVEPDVLIIGAESKKGLIRHFGSQAAYMAKYAPISVFVIR